MHSINIHWRQKLEFDDSAHNFPRDPDKASGVMHNIICTCLVLQLIYSLSHNPRTPIIHLQYNSRIFLYGAHNGEVGSNGVPGSWATGTEDLRNKPKLDQRAIAEFIFFLQAGLRPRGHQSILKTIASQRVCG